MKDELIAPCDMNCAVCSGYIALKNDVKKKGVRMSYPSRHHKVTDTGVTRNAIRIPNLKLGILQDFIFLLVG
jgi:hypothetical protein